MQNVTFDNLRIPEEGAVINRKDLGHKIAVVQFTNGTEETTTVKTEAEAKAIVMAAFKLHGDKVRGGFCATREPTA